MGAKKTLLVTTVKDEGPNILEWVAHHRLCGFDNIQVYYNDTTDYMDRNRNEDQDVELAERSDEVWAKMRRIDEMADGRLMHLRARSLRTWRRRYAEVAEWDDLKALKAMIDPPAKDVTAA